MMKDQSTELEEYIQEGAVIRFTLRGKLTGKKEIKGTINWFDEDWINITTQDLDHGEKLTLSKRQIIGYQKWEESSEAL